MLCTAVATYPHTKEGAERHHRLDVMRLEVGRLDRAVRSTQNTHHQQTTYVSVNSLYPLLGPTHATSTCKFTRLKKQ